MLLTTPAANVPLAILVLIHARQDQLLLIVLPDTQPKPSVLLNAEIPVIPAWQMNLMILATAFLERPVLRDIIVLLTAPAANVRLVQKMKKFVPIPVPAKDIILHNPAGRLVRQRLFAVKPVIITASPAVPIPAPAKDIILHNPAGRLVRRQPFAVKPVIMIVKQLKMPVVKRPETATHNICPIMVII